ncbi:hypothetical protein [Burkholderia stagnalis]|uniref:hypothetical protein n=1 Tax=Burkholderia stagnalis TaxID=1503054 RepID=UPI000F813C00|nr:hypothetical protein [Burkholderia stagnalis]
MQELRTIRDDFSALVASRNFEFVKDGMSSGILVEIGAPDQGVGAGDDMDLQCPDDPAVRSHGFHRHLGWTSTGERDAPDERHPPCAPIWTPSKKQGWQS